MEVGGFCRAEAAVTPGPGFATGLGRGLGKLVLNLLHTGRAVSSPDIARGFAQVASGPSGPLGGSVLCSVAEGSPRLLSARPILFWPGQTGRRAIAWLWRPWGRRRWKWPGESSVGSISVGRPVPGVRPYLVCARTWCAAARLLRPYLVCGRVRLGLVGARGVRGVLRVLVLAFPSPGSLWWFAST